MPVVIPDLGLAVAALFLLLIAGALWVLQGLVRNSFGRLPVVGGWIDRNIDAALNDARNAVLHGAHSAWDGIIRLFDWASSYLYRMWQGTVNTFLAVAGTVANVVDHQLPALARAAAAGIIQAADAVRAYADAKVAAAVRFGTEEIADLRGYTDAIVTAAVQLAARGIADLRRYTDQLVTGAEQLAADELARADTVLRADITAAEQLAAREVAALAAGTQAAVNTLARDITTSVAAAEAVAAARLAAVRGGIYTDLDTWGDQAVARAWPDAAGDLAALRRAIGGDFPWLNDLLGALGGAGAAGLAGALIRSLAGTHAITRLAEDCIVPNCRNLSGLGGALQQLLALGFDAALVGWVAYAIADPEAAARDTDAVAGPLTQATLGTLVSLLGVKV